MPGYDRRGPYGAGPMTGGARGYCSKATQRYGNYRSFGFGRGAGPDRGFPGRGFPGNRGFRAGYGWGPPAGYETSPEAGGSPDVGRNELKAHADAIQENLNVLLRKIAELEKSE